MLSAGESEKLGLNPTRYLSGCLWWWMRINSTVMHLAKALPWLGLWSLPLALASCPWCHPHHTPCHVALHLETVWAQRQTGAPNTTHLCNCGGSIGQAGRQEVVVAVLQVSFLWSPAPPPPQSRPLHFQATVLQKHYNFVKSHITSDVEDTPSQAQN